MEAAFIQAPAEMTPEELEALEGIDVSEYLAEKIVDNKEQGRSFKNWTFRVRWAGYEPEEDSWLNWNAVKNLTLIVRNIHNFISVED